LGLVRTRSPTAAKPAPHCGQLFSSLSLRFHHGGIAFHHCRRRAPTRFYFSSKNSSVPSPSCGDCPGNSSVIGLSKRVYQGFFDVIAAAVFMMNGLIRKKIARLQEAIGNLEFGPTSISAVMTIRCRSMPTGLTYRRWRAAPYATPIQNMSAPSAQGCPSRKSYPRVAMMQSR
jgi:hypothetical protein